MCGGGKGDCGVGGGRSGEDGGTFECEGICDGCVVAVAEGGGSKVEGGVRRSGVGRLVLLVIVLEWNGKKYLFLMFRLWMHLMIDE